MLTKNNFFANRAFFKILVFVYIVTNSTNVNGQSFYKSKNLSIEQITLQEYQKFLKETVPSVFNYIDNKNMPSSMSCLVDSSGINKIIEEYWGEQYTEITHPIWYYCELNNDSCAYSFLVVVDEPISMSTYLLDKDMQVDSVVISGMGELTNDFIYFTTEIFDCDEYVLLKWYSLKNGHVKQIAELKDQSYKYYVVSDENTPGTFSDNKGNFFCSVAHKKTNEIKYYKININNAHIAF